MKIIVLLLCWLVACITNAQVFQPNYDENKVPDYTLPQLLQTSGGEEITSVDQWSDRRNEIYSLFEEHVYGKMPGKPKDVRYELISETNDALNGTANIKEVRIYFSQNGKEHSIELLLFIPVDRTKPVPAFLGLNFRGNQSVHKSRAITVTDRWVKNDENCGIKNNTADMASRGCRNWRWPVNRIIDRGYALATVYYGDIDPDFHDGFKNGVHKLFDQKFTDTVKGNNCAAICAWAWGLSRVMDYFENEDNIDDQKVVVFGHSRLGKTSLWAGASDSRFSIVISNNSGCGGAALSRRAYGETVGKINTTFPHWFCQNFKQYNNNEQNLPVDQHMLIALAAPRPVYAASAQGDQWADPKGEFLAVKHADAVYQLLGKKGLPIDSMPGINHPVFNTTGYHIRNGKHDITNYEWEIYLDFADFHFGFKDFYMLSR